MTTPNTTPIYPYPFPPYGGEGFYSDLNHHMHRLGRDIRETDNDVIKSAHKIETDILRSGYDNTNSILDSAERRGFAEEQRQNRNTQFVLDNINRGTDLALASTERNGSANLLATEKTYGELHAGLGDLQGFLSTQAERLANESITAVGVTQNLINSHAQESIANFGQVQTQAAQYSGKASYELAKTEAALGSKADSQFAALQVQAATNTSNIQIEALKTKNDIMSKMAECCCEIKEKISASEASLQATLSNNETARLRDALQASETKNLILQFQGGDRDRR